MNEQTASGGSEGLFTVAEAAEQAGISVAAAYAAIDRGDLVAIMIIGKKAVTRTSLQAYIKNRAERESKSKEAADTQHNGHP